MIIYHNLFNYSILKKAWIFLFFSLLSFWSKTANGQVDLNNGLVAYYPLDGNANDFSGNNLHGTMINGPVGTMDNRQRPNSAMYFDGINDYIEIPDHPLLRFKNQFSISFLFNRDPASLTAELIEKREWSSGANSSFDIGLVNGGKVRTAIKVGNNCPSPVNGWIYPTVSDITLANTWYCVVAVFNNGKLDFYFNGSFVGSSTSSFTAMDDCIGSTLRLGMHLEFDKLPFKGVIDEVRLYNRELNNQEIGSLCLIDKPPILCSGSLGDPIINIDFGNGTGSAKPLEMLVPGAETSLAYQEVIGNPATPAPADGYYTITNNIPANGSWFSGTSDHTAGDTLGNMLFINSSETPGKFYQQTVTDLCGNETYEFSCWVANVLNSAVSIGIEPDLAFIIESSNGIQIASYQTGGIAQKTQMQWKQFGFLFQTPADVTSVVVKIYNNNVGGGNNPGNDFAIDDITFKACRPLVTASFEKFNIIDSSSHCPGTNFELFGESMDNNPDVITVWQMKKDDEKEWQEMSFSTPGNYTFKIPINETASHYFFRMISANANNRNSPSCMAASNIIRVKILELPLATFSVNEICKGEPSAIIMDASAGSGPFSIQYTDGRNIFFQDQLFSKDSLIKSLDSTTIFSFTSLKDKYGCEIKGDIARITAVVKPTPSIEFPPISPVCDNDTNLKQLVFSEATGSAGKTIFSDNRINQEGQYRPSDFDTGAYSITYSFLSENGCSARESEILNILPSPASKGAINLMACHGQEIQLKVTGGTEYLWSPDTGLSDPFIANPTATVYDDIQYMVKIKNNEGCFGIDTFNISSITHSNLNFKLPNAFTPNKDGKNDCFGISHWGRVNLNQFRIFNRWGQLVFETKNPTMCWNGDFKGLNQPTGSYVYIISAVTGCGPINLKGVINLIR